MPWQGNAVAESQWRGGGVAQAEESPGGRACWEGSMAHLTPACPLLNRARPLAPLIHSPPGNEVVQLLQMSVHSWMQLLGMICWCMTSGVVTKWSKFLFLLCLLGEFPDNSTKQQIQAGINSWVSTREDFRFHVVYLSRYFAVLPHIIDYQFKASEHMFLSEFVGSPHFKYKENSIHELWSSSQLPQCWKLLST